MKIVDSLKHRLTGLLTAPKEELGSWARFLQFQIQLWRVCARRLRQNNALAMSSALSFRTIFALVPTIILAFLVLKSFGIIEDRRKTLRNFLDQSGLSQIVYVRPARTRAATAPAMTEEQRRVALEEKLQAIVGRVERQLTVGRLGPIGVALFIWTALTLVTTIERCLNRIFEAPRSRSLSRRILLYWSAITLGPLALVAVQYAAEAAVTAVHNVPVLSWVIGSIVWLVPVLVGIGLVAALYQLMPNTRVRFRSAVEGALVAVPIWLVARWAFSLYIDRVGKQSIYGAMALVPLFLLWLNLSWWIFLFGAELAHATANLSRLQFADRRKGGLLGPWDLLAAVVAIARGNVANGGPVPVEQVSASVGLSEQATGDLLSRLASGGVVCRVEVDAAGLRPPKRATAAQAGGYLLARPADRIDVSGILRIGCPFCEGDPGRDGAPEVLEAIRRVRARSEANIEKLTIAEVISG